MLSFVLVDLLFLCSTSSISVDVLVDLPQENPFPRRIGEDNVLECLIRAHRLDYYYWTKDGYSLAGTKYRTEVEYPYGDKAPHLTTLVKLVFRAIEADVGLYTCHGGSTLRGHMADRKTLELVGKFTG